MTSKKNKTKPSSRWETFRTSLLSQVDSSTLGAFRIIFGLALVWSTCKSLLFDMVAFSYIDPKFHFPYEWFPWIAPLPGNGMYFVYAAMAGAAFSLAIGLFYRLSAFIFTLVYTYVFLIDQVDYNNHYYLICLLGLLFTLTNADRWMSVDAWRKKNFPDTIPYWQLLIFKAQIFIVYFYGGIAKLNWDWLRGEPMRHWIIESAESNLTPPIVRSFFEHDMAAYFFSYGGLIFDLAIGFLLIYRKTRLVAIGVLLFFHLTNAWLFSIGIFPYLMIGAIVLFLELDTPRNILIKFIPQLEKKKLAIAKIPAKLKKPALAFFTIYMAIQILLPFRHWLYEGNDCWTEEGHSFAWHMKLRSKKYCHLNFLATDPATGKTWEIRTEDILTFRQFSKMCQQPRMIYQYAQYLGKKLESEGIKNPIIKVNSWARFNFRPFKRMIDPDANLYEEEFTTFSSAKWILPLGE
jgi:hypothetical protein